MASHALKLTYDGLGATQHKMPTSLEKQVTGGAQEFLGAHAYFFTEGRIPENVGDRSKRFHIHDLRKRSGSWEAIYAIDFAKIASDFLNEYTRELTKDLAIEAALATKLGFLYLIHRSYKAWKERRPLMDRAFDHDESVLSEVAGNYAPMLDVEAEQEAQRRKLFERTNSSMSKITAPIGRASTHLDIWLDDVHLDHVERRFYSDEEITAALLPLRAQVTGRQSDSDPRLSRLTPRVVPSGGVGRRY